ncbi:uncharacterized protein PHALS_13001 [Plasmopara halstedii]|uniref:Uncharacterized protein n=1 Tax=Plasmopara halstedii TaxID=4781 RepID=A0A0P1AP05_PLAHL|nr:uncharacterized protein PHALS_13001 [Plasmopara halstedii]CEG42751.1 hypothetical protein PHALS_13001 [Plasmopara halstedii]|eukprot:XP_024579120.1 hypothetical protein PHALS_13001 [Plasmopara halstedii]
MDDKSDWLLDSGASSPIIPDREAFHTYKELKKALVLQLLMVNHFMRLIVGYSQLQKLTPKGLTVSFSIKVCTISRGEESIATVPQANNEYRVKKQAQTVSGIFHQE